MGGVVLSAILYRFRSNRYLLFGASWYLITILPALILASHYRISMADRHAYLPAIGIAMVVAQAVSALPVGRLYALSGCLILMFSITSFMATKIWRDNGILSEQMIALEPGLEAGYLQRALHSMRSADIEHALDVVVKGVQAGAITQAGATDVKIDLLVRHGENLLQSGRYLEAAPFFEDALKANPGHIPALIDLGGVMAQSGDLQGALGIFHRAASLEPNNPVPRYNISEAQRMLGNTAEAEKEYAEYRRLQYGKR